MGTAHIAIDAGELNARQAYKLLTGVVVPRPIAWITTVSREGQVNLAPFSAFTLVSNDPPMVGVNIGLRAGQPKDTAANIEACREFVVNIPSWSMHRDVHESSIAYEPGVNEAEILGLSLVESDAVDVPRLAEARVSMECKLVRTVVFGRAGARFTVGEVLRFHIAEGLLVDGKVRTLDLDPVARLAGPNYGRLGETSTLPPVPKSVSTARTRFSRTTR